MKVWIVERGEYSGRYVAAVFATSDLADANARAHGGSVDEFDVETVLDEKAQRHLRPGERLYHVSMNEDGNEAQSFAIWTEGDNAKVGAIHWRPPSGRETVGRMTFSTWASDEKHAIKIANEQRTGWLISGAPKVGHDSDHYGWRLVGSPGAAGGR